MTDKLDFKKRDKELYAPGRTPSAVEVGPMVFFAVDGQGEPGGAAYAAALQALYALTFTVKMSKNGSMQPQGYMDYVAPPLEGFWSGEDGALDLETPRASWHWTSCIRQPEFVTEEVFRWAVEECRRKKPDTDVSQVYRWAYTEGLCVQALHAGPYAWEAATMREMAVYCGDNGLRVCTGLERRHHEIYLGDPRKTAPERLRTVLRIPVEREG